MTAKQKKVLKNGLRNASEFIPAALEKLSDDPREKSLEEKFFALQNLINDIIRDVEKVKTKEVVAPKKKSKSKTNTKGMNNVEIYLLKHPEKKGELEEFDEYAANTTCRHYCGDYCDIGMDMTFCSTKCAYCSNMPGSSKVYG